MGRGRLSVAAPMSFMSQRRRGSSRAEPPPRDRRGNRSDGYECGRRLAGVLPAGLRGNLCSSGRSSIHTSASLHASGHGGRGPHAGDQVRAADVDLAVERERDGGRRAASSRSPSNVTMRSNLRLAPRGEDRDAPAAAAKHSRRNLGPRTRGNVWSGRRTRCTGKRKGAFLVSCAGGQRLPESSSVEPPSRGIDFRGHARRCRPSARSTGTKSEKPACPYPPRSVSEPRGNRLDRAGRPPRRSRSGPSCSRPPGRGSAARSSEAM